MVKTVFSDGGSRWDRDMHTGSFMRALHTKCTVPDFNRCLQESVKGQGQGRQQHGRDFAWTDKRGLLHGYTPTWDSTLWRPNHVCLISSWTFLPTHPLSLPPVLQVCLPLFPTFDISVFFFFFLNLPLLTIFPGVRIFISAFSQSTALTIFLPDPTHVCLSIFSAWLHIEL